MPTLLRRERGGKKKKKRERDRWFSHDDPRRQTNKTPGFFFSRSLASFSHLFFPISFPPRLSVCACAMGCMQGF